MTLFDAPPLRPPFKYRRQVIAAIAAVVIAAITMFWLLRFHSEYVSTRRVMDAVVAGDFPRAYQLWKPAPSYSFQDFLQDWGPDGYYGPVKSYRIDYHLSDRKGGAVEITVDLSPYAPFPDDDDIVKSSKTKHARLWVSPGTQSLSFSPD